MVFPGIFCICGEHVSKFQGSESWIPYTATTKGIISPWKKNSRLEPRGCRVGLTEIRLNMSRNWFPLLKTFEGMSSGEDSRRVQHGAGVLIRSAMTKNVRHEPGRDVLIRGDYRLILTKGKHGKFYGENNMRAYWFT